MDLRGQEGKSIGLLLFLDDGWFPFTRGGEAGLEVLLEEEELGIDLTHSQSPSPSRGEVNRRTFLSPHYLGSFLFDLQG